MRLEYAMDSLATRAAMLKVALVVVGTAWLAEGLAVLVYIMGGQDVIPSGLWDVWAAMETAYPVFFLGTAVLFVAWSYRAHANLRLLGREGVVHSDQATIWWWITPVAVVWMPFRVIYETVRGSTAMPQDRNWRKYPLDVLVKAWTVLFVTGLLISGIAPNYVDVDGSSDSVFAGLIVAVAVAVLMMLAALSAFTMVKTVGGGQSLLAESISQAAEAGPSSMPELPTALKSFARGLLFIVIGFVVATVAVIGLSFAGMNDPASVGGAHLLIWGLTTWRLFRSTRAEGAPPRLDGGGEASADTTQPVEDPETPGRDDRSRRPGAR